MKRALAHLLTGELAAKIFKYFEVMRTSKTKVITGIVATYELQLS